MDTLNFICSNSECSGRLLEAVNHDVSTYQRVFVDTSGHEEFDGIVETYGGDFVGYRCETCGEVVLDEDGGEICDSETLAE